MGNPYKVQTSLVLKFTCSKKTDGDKIHHENKGRLGGACTLSDCLGAEPL